MGWVSPTVSGENGRNAGQGPTFDVWLIRDLVRLVGVISGAPGEMYALDVTLCERWWWLTMREYSLASLP